MNSLQDCLKKQVLSPRTMKKHLAVINRSDSPYISEQEIISLRHAISKGAEELLEAFNKRSEVFIITPEQSQKGLNWLKERNFTKKGKIRKNAMVEPWDEAFLKECLNNFSHFTLTDLEDISFYGRVNYVPVYTLHTLNGKKFTYSVSGQGQVYDYSISE